MLIREHIFSTFVMFFLSGNILSGNRPTKIRPRVSDKTEFNNTTASHMRDECKRFFEGSTSALGQYCAINGTKVCYTVTIVSTNQQLKHNQVHLNNLTQAINEEFGKFDSKDRGLFIQECLNKQN